MPSRANGALLLTGFQQHSRPAHKSPLLYAQTHKTLILRDHSHKRPLRMCREILASVPSHSEKF